MRGYAAVVQRGLFIRVAIFLAAIVPVAVFVSYNWGYARGVVQGVISEIITLIILGVFSYIVYNTRERSVRLDFFDVKQSKRMYVYLSRVYVIKGGSKGVDDVPRTFEGISIPDYEAIYIPHFQSLFNFIVPGTENVTGFLQRLFVIDISVKFLASPATEAGVESDGTLVSLGSPMYNAASSMIEKHFEPPVTFSQAGFLQMQEAKEAPLCGDNNCADNRCAFVQRVRYKRTGQTAFYLAGPSIPATSAAIHYFLDNWRQLAKEYRKGETFCIIVHAESDEGDKYREVCRVDIQEKRPVAICGGLLAFSLLLVGYAAMWRRPRH